jgi:hypothetical protein
MMNWQKTLHTDHITDDSPYQQSANQYPADNFRSFADFVRTVTDISDDVID